MIPAGLIGSIFFVLIVKKTKAFKKVLCLVTILGASFFVVTMIAIATKSFLLVLITIALLGFTAAPAQPISLEFACELTFPAGEASAGGLIISIGQLTSAIEVKLSEKLILTFN